MVDCHGSDLVWKKALRMARSIKADVLICAGDLAGKAVIPVVRRGSTEWFYSPWGREIVLHSKEALEKAMNEIQCKGYYPVEVTPEEVEELQADNDKLQALFLNLMVKTLDRWLNMVSEYVPNHVKVIVSPGNDDPLEIDDVIKQNDRVIYPLNKAIDIGDKYVVISCAWSNPTPWNTLRECPEEKLREKLEKEFSRTNERENLICNFHVPPYGTTLDLAPKLDETLKPVTNWGSVVQIHVGSKAVRELLEKYQPLFGLHGHIHEHRGVDRLGRTICINPGSEYGQGMLTAYAINLDEKVEYWRINA